MLKNKFKVIALVMLLILSLTMPSVRADDEVTDTTSKVTPRAVTDSTSEATPNAVTANDSNQAPVEVSDEDGIMPISEGVEENDDKESESSAEHSDIKNSDQYLYGTDIVVDYPVDGNLFAFGDTVTINSQIGGNAFIIANKVIIGTGGYVYSSLFTCAKDVEVSGLIYDLYACAENVNIKGYVSRDIKVNSVNLNLTGMVGRNAFVSVKNVSFDTVDDNETVSSHGVIYGDFNYTSSEEISIPEGVVNGEAHFTQAVTQSESKSIQSYILALGTFVCTVAIIWLLLLWLTPKFQNKAGELLAKKTLPVIGYGLLTPIALFVVALLFILLNITSSIAFLTIFMFILFACVSSSVFVISVNDLICKKLKIEKNTTVFGMLIASSAVLWLLTLIPTLGSIISFVAWVLGLGIIMKSIIPARAKKADKVVEVKAEENK